MGRGIEAPNLSLWYVADFADVRCGGPGKGCTLPERDYTEWSSEGVALLDPQWLQKYDGSDVRIVTRGSREAMCAMIAIDLGPGRRGEQKKGNEVTSNVGMFKWKGEVERYART